MTDKWTFWKKIQIPDFNDPNQIYLTRWKILKTPWFGIYLHHIHLPDADRALHTHPWTMATFILKGGYREEIPQHPRYPTRARITREWGPGSLHIIPFPKGADRGHAHRISEHLTGSTWSLLAVGKWQKEWVFETDQGPVQHDVYHRMLGKDHLLLK